MAMTPRKFGKFAAVVLLSAVVLSSAVLAKDTPKERTQPRAASAMPFTPSEQLVYEGEFTKLLLRGIDVAELRFKASRPAPAAATAPPGEGDAQTTPAANTQPLRVLYVRPGEGRDRLVKHMSEGNRAKTASAPAVAVDPALAEAGRLDRRDSCIRRGNGHRLPGHQRATLPRC